MGFLDSVGDFYKDILDPAGLGHKGGVYRGKLGPVDLYAKPKVPTFKPPTLGDPLAAGANAKQAAKDKALLAYGIGSTVLTKPKGLGSAPSGNLLYPSVLGA